MIKKIDAELCNEALKAEPEEMKKCQYCGKEYKWFDKQLGSIRIHTQVAACNCLEEIEKKKEAARIAEAKKERLAKLFDNSMMTPFFAEKKFENLKKTEHFEFCKKYAEEFNPKTTKGIRMFGVKGTGKTTLLAAICNELMAKNYSCLFTTLSALLDRFSKYSYENAGEIAPLLQWLTSFDFVVLDDIGREKYNDRRNEMAFRIIDALLNYKVCTCISANPEMLKRLQEIVEWQAILDRLKDICSLKLQFTGNSLRGLKW
jgi:DNA replication protein DnaC